MSNTTEIHKPRRDEILDAATRLFAERGYDGTSMNDVAERVGMRKASLFYHFATKDALYEAVIDRVVASFQEPLEKIYASSGTFSERLDVLTATLVGALAARPHAARLLLREAMDWGPQMRGKMLDRILLVLEAGAAWIRTGQAEGEFAEADPKQMVLSAIGMHFVPFAIGQVVERYLGIDPFGPEFVAARRTELQRETRAMHLRRG
jgi:AcrR family transcriptional regulator